MRRLTAADALFLYNELPTQHMHTLKLAIFDYSSHPAGYSFNPSGVLTVRQRSGGSRSRRAASFSFSRSNE